jgi:hypothetical protein
MQITKKINRQFSDLPAEYQIGCNLIEKQCHKLLEASKIKITRLYWDNLNLSNCYLYVEVENKKFHVKFGKRALTHYDEPGMSQTILIRLKGLIRKINLYIKY